jgi:hypothetical protein
MFAFEKSVRTGSVQNDAGEPQILLSANVSCVANLHIEAISSKWSMPSLSESASDERER